MADMQTPVRLLHFLGLHQNPSESSQTVRLSTVCWKLSGAKASKPMAADIIPWALLLHSCFHSPIASVPRFFNNTQNGPNSNHILMPLSNGAKLHADFWLEASVTFLCALCKYFLWYLSNSGRCKQWSAAAATMADSFISVHAVLGWS